MGRPIFKSALVAGLAIAGASTAFAQFGFIFGDPPPRPPGSVGQQPTPGGPRSMPSPPSYPPPQQQYPAQSYPSGPYARPPVQSYPSGPYGGAQSQPLPPPPGASQRPAPRPARVPPAPADTSVQPGDEVVAAPPPEKIANPQAVFSGLDKITGRIIHFDVAIGETVQFGALQLTTRACYTRPPTETANTDAFVEVDEVTLQGEVKRIFTGWMFAASPGLHAVEHPIYDLWLTDCKGATPTVAAEAPPERPPPAAKQQQKRAPQAKQQRRPPPPRQPQGYPPFR